MKLLLLIDLKEKYINEIQDSFANVEILKCLKLEKQKREIVDAEIVISGGDGIKLELLEKAEKLNWIQAWSAGLDSFNNTATLNYLKEKGIKVTSTSGIHADPISEHVMGFLLNHSRRLYDFYELQKKQKWEWLTVNQLSGKTIAIIGIGSIGKEIAFKAKAFKMKTIAVKKNINESLDHIDELYSNKELLQLLPRADYVVVTVPLTDETRAMFGEKEFKAMKESAFFVNIARGEVVDEKAMIRAFEDGEIDGAALDVFEEEPLNINSPLYSLENVYITPHISGAYPDYNKNAIKIFKENLKRFNDGSDLLNLMDYAKGY
ncbi:D-2-hydroxyacid dehydrogenase [Natronospora cellulosivora (SeqCode)]